jgi:hypothetical protein
MIVSSIDKEVPPPLPLVTLSCTLHDGSYQRPEFDMFAPRSRQSWLFTLGISFTAACLVPFTQPRRRDARGVAVAETGEKMQVEKALERV